MYSRAKSYGGVKGRPPHAGTGKRAVAAAAGVAAARAAMRAQSSRVGAQYRRGGGETKYFDTSFAQAVSAAADWTGSEVPCTNYIQSDGTTVGAYTDSALIPSANGTGYGQIIGNKYHIKKIRVRGEITSLLASDQADVPQPATVRVVLVQDLRANGAQSQGEDVFPDMGTAAQQAFAFLAMGSGNAGKFKILADEWCVLEPTVAGTDGASTNSVCRGAKTFSFQWKPKTPHQVLLKANSTTPTVASLSNTNIFLLAHTSQSSGGTTSINGCARCYYTD